MGIAGITIIIKASTSRKKHAMRISTTPKATSHPRRSLKEGAAGGIVGRALTVSTVAPGFPGMKHSTAPVAKSPEEDHLQFSFRSWIYAMAQPTAHYTLRVTTLPQ